MLWSVAEGTSASATAIARDYAHDDAYPLRRLPVPLPSSPLRPQLPFLCQSTARPSQTAIARFISTERKELWKRRLWRNVQFQLALWPALILGTIFAVGIKHLKYEHDFPTPRDWSFWSRWAFRNAAAAETEKIDGVLTDWSKAGLYYSELLKRLEDGKLDGDGVNVVDIGVGAGPADETARPNGWCPVLDISSKSAQWQRGYYQALMGAARAAEHLDGMARKKGEPRSKPIPWDSIPGPTNPRPRPLPWDKKGAYRNVPSAFECEDAYDPPGSFYNAILANHAFTTAERLDAALAYADWCDFKGRQDMAAELYDQALNLAAAALPVPAKSVVDRSTGVLLAGQDEHVSQNLFKATTALATYRARHGDVKQALPIFLSVLRARKSLPPQPAQHQESKPVSTAESGFQAYWTAIKEALFDTPYPPLPPSGDQRPYYTLKEACEEVAVMTYVGEILFATSNSAKEKGLAWTRDSVDAAEAVLWLMDEQGEHTGHEKCRQCLETGLSNWKDMLRQMQRLALDKVHTAQQSHGWLGTGLGKASAVERAADDLARWREEEHQIELRQQKTDPLVTLSKINTPKLEAWG
ncbi:hypothetical protein DV737_g2497, partial [Chaetothyriales sp. CBS 132003]